MDWHTFNNRWAEEIRVAGGLDIIFADCFRGFEKGCGSLVNDLLQKRTFRRGAVAGAPPRCNLTFAVSDRYDRSQGWSAAAAALKMTIDLQGLFSDPACPYVGRVLSQVPYGRTMHYFQAEVHDREWVQHVDGFVPQVVHWQSH